MSGFETIKIVNPEERRAYVPSDVMSLASYAAFKAQFNARLDVENAKIQARNARLHSSQRPEPELEAYPLETVLMICDKQFIVTRQDFKRVVIPRGVFECPVELSDDWYIRANGVQVYVHPVAAPIKSVEETKPAKSKNGLKNLVNPKAEQV